MDFSFLAHSPAKDQWERIAIKPHHGIAIPLFSLHTQYSTGIGEFPDLIPLIDWCVSIGFDIIQLLPLNDTEEGSSPYAAHTAFALNPIFIGLHHLPFLEEDSSLQSELKEIPPFSYASRIDYLLVRNQKKKFLSHYYEKAGHKILESQDYKEFIREAEAWLKGYCFFKVLAKKNHFYSWESWPDEEKIPSIELFEKIERENKQEMDFYSVLQFLCDLQMKNAKDYASQKHVYLMGDIPILIDRNSADVWLYPEWFDLNYSAGAPPDMYSEEGQNWGFPLYKWNRMAESGYEWWKNRLKWANRYYHIYRIDHIVGFFRIWSIPHGLTGKEGYFLPQEESAWNDHGKELMLMMLQSCEMLPIGEDLGVIPLDVRTCLSALGICGTKVIRWERKWEEDGRFIPYEEYPALSLTTVSTHDSETLYQWWLQKPEEARLFSNFKNWEHQPLLIPEYHQQILWDSHHTHSLFHINPLQEYLSLLPDLSWEDPEEERINIPGTISDRNWSYRLRPSIEELIANQQLKEIMQKFIT